MSRWEIAKETVAGVLKGRESELSINPETKIHARVFFRMAYWRESDHREVMVALITLKFMIAGWTIHGGGEGLNVEFLLVDSQEEP